MSSEHIPDHCVWNELCGVLGDFAVVGGEMRDLVTKDVEKREQNGGERDVQYRRRRERSPVSNNARTYEYFSMQMKQITQNS